MTEWRTIPGHQNYEVSEAGEIRRATPGKRTRVGKLKKLHRNRRGYVGTTLYENGVPTFMQAHVAVCLAFHGPAPSPEHEAAHGDGDNGHNHCDNLRWATPGENAADRDSHGRTARCQRSGTAKLLDADVMEIRGLIAAGQSKRAIAAHFGVSDDTIYLIGARKTWRGLPELNPS